MDLDPARQLLSDLDFGIGGHDATVTLPFGGPVTARIKWGGNVIEDAPGGVEFNRRGPRRLMALQRSSFSEVPRGTTITAPERPGDEPSDWQVDGIEETTRTHFVVKVLPATGMVAGIT